LASPQLAENFFLPLSEEAHAQFLILQSLLDNLVSTPNPDIWTYIWGNSSFSANKAYKKLIGHSQVHPAFQWIWRSKCQMKHKVFFWLLLMDKNPTRDILRRKNMILDSYTCDLCILQRPETSAHLFLRCNFAKGCWASIGVTVTTSTSIFRIFNRIRRRLQVPFFMEIIILMTWSIWTTRND
jgi:hypothetical protein